MEVTTNQEISYCIRLTPTEARYIAILLRDVAKDKGWNIDKRSLATAVADSIADQIKSNEGTDI